MSACLILVAAAQLVDSHTPTQDGFDTALLRTTVLILVPPSCPSDLHQAPARLPTNLTQSALRFCSHKRKRDEAFDTQPDDEDFIVISEDSGEAIDEDQDSDEAIVEDHDSDEVIDEDLNEDSSEEVNEAIDQELELELQGEVNQGSNEEVDLLSNTLEHLMTESIHLLKKSWKRKTDKEETQITNDL